MITACHSGNCGDIICATPCIISLCNQRNTKCDLYLKIDVPATYARNIVHPLGNVTLNRDFANKLIPLIQCQPWCNSVQIHTNEECEFNLDLFRLCFNNRTNLPKYYFYTYHSWYNLSQPWLWVAPNKDYQNCIIVNRTNRYKQLMMRYNRLEGYPVVFVGLKEEFEDFRKEVSNAEYVQADNFLELARIIAAANMFIGNQSFCYWLAEAMKVKPRVLEIYQESWNVIPNGDDAYDFINYFGFDALMDAILPKLYSSNMLR